MADEAASSAAPAAIPSPAEAANESSNETSANPAESIQAKAPEAKKPEIPASVKRKLKLKVDGKEFEEEFDPNNDEYITKQLQLAKMGQKRAQEFANLQKEVGSFIEELRKNPRKVLQDPNIGIDLKKLAAEMIEEEIANSQKSPDQIKREELEAKLKELSEEREKEKEENRTKEFQRLQQQEFERYDMLMTQTLEKSDLPKSPYVVKKMADYMLMGLQQGIEVTPQDVLPLVREEMQDDLKQMFAVMPEEVIEALVGKDTINRIRKKNLAKGKPQPPIPVKAGVKDIGKTAEPKKKVEAPKTFKDFFGV